jgi:cyclopropane-fatty-acyl-phospholipid synthase
MTTSGKQIYEKLAKAGIFGPSSDECALFERHLTRYFEREYQRYIDNPVSLEDLGISTDNGPIMEETDALMGTHYDVEQRFFSCFLDDYYKAYSMAYYGNTTKIIRKSQATLEEAQHRKYCLIADRAQIQGNENILNIGCGFGSFETFLLANFPSIRVVGITPSKVQISYIRKRMQNISDPLSSGRFKLIAGSFDQLPLQTLGIGRYEIVTSVAVFEQVINMDRVMERISKLLTPEGRTFHHFLTSRLVIPKFLDPDKTRIGIYFPGGRVWPCDEFSKHTMHFNLINKWFINGLNYWRTLDEWHRRYWSNIPSLYGSVFDTKAIAHWNNYFSLCKAMFAPMNGDFYGNSHYLFKLRD